MARDHRGTGQHSRRLHSDGFRLCSWEIPNADRGATLRAAWAASCPATSRSRVCGTRLASRALTYFHDGANHRYPKKAAAASRKKPSDAVTVISYDEKPGIQAIATMAPDLPPVPGMHATLGRA